MGKIAQFWQASKAWVPRHPRKTFVIALVGVLIVSGLVGFIIDQNSDHTSDEPKNPIARQFKQQLPSLKEKAEKNPSSFDAQRDYAVALYATGDTKEAEERYERALRIREDATTYNNLANTQRDLGNYNDAVDTYKKAIKANPKLVNPYTNLANIQMYSLNKTDDAIDTYRQALKEIPNDPSLQVLLALAYEKKGDIPSAKQVLKSAQAANPEDKSIQANLARIEQ